MDQNRKLEISSRLERWRFEKQGSWRYMSGLHDAAEDLSISKDEMFEFCLEVMNPELAKYVHEPEKIVSEEVRSKKVYELDFSPRTLHCFRNAGITTIEELLKRTDEELLTIKNLGEQTLKDIKRVLNSLV